MDEFISTCKRELAGRPRSSVLLFLFSVSGCKDYFQSSIGKKHAQFFRKALTKPSVGFICREMKPQSKERAVLVTTEYKGVFFGYAEETSGETIKLKRARNCVYWPSSNQGFMGLAEHGPKDGARIGPRADIELRKITSVSEVTPDAVKRWEGFKWSA